MAEVAVVFSRERTVIYASHIVAALFSCGPEQR